VLQSVFSEINSYQKLSNQMTRNWNFLDRALRSNRWSDFHALGLCLKRHVSTQEGAFTALGLRTIIVSVRYLV